MCDNNNRTLIRSQIIFNETNITGIKCQRLCEDDENLNLVLFGDRFLTIYKLIEKDNDLIELCSPFDFNDWILDVRIEDNIVLVALAHNEVAIFDWTTRRILSVNKYTGTRCILYCAHFISTSQHQFCIAAGTVFREIVIWSYSKDRFCNIQTLLGHDGIIFALDYNKHLNILASASDDRSVRIWSDQSTETPKSMDQCEIDFVLKYILYSHEARIWKVVVMNKPYTIAISAGEDGAVCFWDINNGSLIQKEKACKNVRIWSLAVNDNSLYAFVGGSDSQVLSWNIEDVLQKFHSQKLFQLDHLNGCKFMSFVKSKNNRSNLFILTENGQLLFKNDDHFNFSHSENIKNCCAICVNDERSMIILGDKNGKIIQFVTETNSIVITKTAHEGKIFSLCFLNDSYFLSCGPKGEMKIWNLTMESERNILLPPSRHQWPTAALMNEQFLVIGDGSGNIFVYLINSLESPTQIFQGIFGHNEVTCIKRKSKTNLFYASGRNGKIFEFLFKDKEIVLLRCLKSFANLEWITKLIFNNLNETLDYVVGFNGKSFDVWNDKESRLIWTIECGGGHRQWDFQICDNNLHFVYVKQDQIFWHKKKLLEKPNKHLNELDHFNPRKINCCSILPYQKFPDIFYIASGGEDNQIYVYEVNYKSKKFNFKLNLFGHISSVSAIDSCSTEQNDICYLVSVGGRSQMIIWKLEVIEEKIFCQQLICNYLSTGKNQRKPWKDPSILNNIPQLKYIHVKIRMNEDKNLLIATSCSDCSLRLFKFDNQKELILLSVINFENICIFNLNFLINSKIIFGTSDGMLKIISFEGSHTNQINFNHDIKDIKLNCHQSGINSLDIYNLKGK